MIRIEIAGTPVPQGSVRAFIAGGRAVVAGPGGTLRSWRAEVADAARHECAKHLVPGEPLLFPKGTAVAVGLLFRVATLNKFIGPYGLLPTTPLFPFTAPDRDKLVRAVGDAVTAAGLVWSDDCQDAVGCAAKVYVPPGDWTGVIAFLAPAETSYGHVFQAMALEIHNAQVALTSCWEAAEAGKLAAAQAVAQQRAAREDAVRAERDSRNARRLQERAAKAEAVQAEKAAKAAAKKLKKTKKSIETEVPCVD